MSDHVMRLANNQHVVFPGRQPEQCVQPVPQRMLQRVPRMYARLIEACAGAPARTLVFAKVDAEVQGLAIRESGFLAATHANLTAAGARRVGTSLPDSATLPLPRELGIYTNAEKAVANGDTIAEMSGFVVDRAPSVTQLAPVLALGGIGMTATDFHRDATQVDVPPGLMPGDKLYVFPPPFAACRFCNQILGTSPPGFKQNSKICCPALDDTSQWPEDESA
jgi:hypothetical protein